MSVAVFTDEEYGGGGHDFPLLDCGHDFSMLDGGGGVIPQLFEKPHPSSEELENNQKKSGDHHRFEPLGGGGGTWRRRKRRTYITDSCSNRESVSVTSPTATDLLSQIMLNIAFKLITLKGFVSVPEANIRNYLLKSSICSPPPEGNNAFIGLVSDDDEDFDDDDDDDGEYFDAEYLDSPDASPHLHPPILGIPFVEVFSVVINTNKNKNMEKKPPGGQAGGVSSSLSLYGTISLNDGLTFTPEYIYNTKREDTKSISLSGGGGKKTALLLTGLSRPFSACDTLNIKLDLMVDNKDRTLSPDDGDGDDDDDVFCRGRIYWNFFTGLCRKYENGKVSSEVDDIPPPYIFDQPLASNFVGRFGSVKVNYIMWWVGVGATVEVTLLNRDGADVYGLIRAGNTCCSSTYWSVLFQKKKKKKSDDSINVRPGQLIPLSRSLVAVNQSSSLKVSVELYDRRRYRQLSQDDDEIAKGTVDFPAKSSGTSEENISGRYGEIRVKVTWCPG